MRNKIVLVIAILVGSVGFTSCSQSAAPPGYRTSFNAQKTKSHYGTRGNYSTRRNYWGGKKYGHRPHGQRGKYRGV